MYGHFKKYQINNACISKRAKDERTNELTNNGRRRMPFSDLFERSQSRSDAPSLPPPPLSPIMNGAKVDASLRRRTIDVRFNLSDDKIAVCFDDCFLYDAALSHPLPPEIWLDRGKWAHLGVRGGGWL